MKLKDKLTLQGKATIGTGVVLFGGMEGLMHMGSAGLYLAGAGTIIAFLHGTKFVRAGGYVKDKVIIGSEQVVSQVVQGSATPRTISGHATILLGTDRKNNEVRRSLSELKSILILALPGQGKSTAASHILGQIIEQGGRIAIIDRHARSNESLSAMLSPFEAAFSMPPAYEPQSSMETLQYADETLNARMDGTQSSDTPFILVIDEMTDILKKLQQKSPWGDVSRSIADVVEGYNAMGRKYNCFVVAIGQLTNASRTGGTEIRELFTTRLIGGMQESQAKLILPKEIASQVPNLQVGEWIAALEGKEEPFKITVPRLSKDRIKQIAASIQRDPLDELAEIEDIDPDDSRYEQEPIRPILPEEGKRAEEIDLDLAVLVWNAGQNTVSKLMKTFRLTNHQARKLRDTILSQADVIDQAGE